MFSEAEFSTALLRADPHAPAVDVHTFLRLPPGKFRAVPCWDAVRSAWRSAQTKASANPAANNESRLPIARIAARLTTVSRVSLAKVANAQRRTSDSSPACAAFTVPRPKTRSRIPIVLIRRSAVPVGDSVPASRIGAPGATIRATPTDVRSHPIELVRIATMARSYRSRGNWRSAAPPGVSDVRDERVAPGWVSPHQANALFYCGIVDGKRSRTPSRGSYPRQRPAARES